MARRRGSLRATCGRRDRNDHAGEDADALRIARRIQAGEHDLFDVLYDRYFDRIYGYLNSLLGPHDAEDVVQQVFLHVVEALARGPHPRKSFDAWIYKIAHNAAIDHQRSRGPWQATEPQELTAEIEKVRDALSHNPRQGFDYLSDALLLAALRRLSVMSREIIVLRYVAGFPMTDIARLIDTTVGAVTQAHHAAMKALRMELLPDGPSPDLAVGRGRCVGLRSRG